MNCGDDAYLKSYGQPFCQRFLSHQTEVSLEVQNWFQKVRQCLQKELSSPTLTCQDLDAVATQSHIDCYVTTGYCELSPSATREVYSLISDLLVNPWAVWTGLRIQRECQLRQPRPN